MMRLPFQKLKIWQKGIDLADLVYDATGTFPKTEQYGLAQQSRECSVSISSNIAEGSQQTSDKQFAHFIRISKGSLAELHTQMIIAKRRKLLSKEYEEKIIPLIEELDRMIFAFHQKLISRKPTLIASR